eukprot:CCRYP_009650-RA/>CCRYP_009650-RA protein AED:0.63 eAED:0.36 QI:0/0/0/1/1/1/2/0/211
MKLPTPLQNTYAAMTSNGNSSHPRTRVNARSRPYKPSKIISSLDSLYDRNFPSQLWDNFLQQAQDSLNMLRTSQIDPTKSTYEILEGPHDFNRNPWAPTRMPGRTPQTSNPTDIMGPPGYWRLISTASQHPAKFFPTYCDLPTESPLEAAARTAAELLTSSSANNATNRTQASYPATNGPSRSSMTSANSTSSNLRGGYPCRTTSGGTNPI